MHYALSTCLASPPVDQIGYVDPQPCAYCQSDTPCPATPGTTAWVNNQTDPSQQALARDLHKMLIPDLAVGQRHNRDRVRVVVEDMVPRWTPFSLACPPRRTP